MTTLSLFSGIGGFDLGAERAGMTIVGQCEIDPFCRAVLAKHWPDVPCHDDVTTLDPYAFGPVDCVIGGFPCQDVSCAGKGLGVDAGARSGLWREMYRVIDAIRPRWVIAENVPALRTRGADRVLGDLERIGYTCTPLVVGADDIGAPHRRKRVWIVARLDDTKGQRRHLVGSNNRKATRVIDSFGDASKNDLEVAQSGSGRLENSGVSPRSRNQGARATGITGTGEGPVADTLSDGRRAGRGVGGDEGGSRIGRGELAGGGQLADTDPRGLGADRPAPGGGSDADERVEDMEHAVGAGLEERDTAAKPSGTRFDRWPMPPGNQQHEWEAPRLVELPLGGTVDGLPVRLVRFANRNALKAYGNSVVPQVAEIVCRAVMMEESR